MKTNTINLIAYVHPMFLYFELESFLCIRFESTIRLSTLIIRKSIEALHFLFAIKLQRKLRCPNFFRVHLITYLIRLVRETKNNPSKGTE